MLTKRNLDNYLSNVKDACIRHGYLPSKIMLFGSYAKGGVHQHSDIDIAIWCNKFSGNPLEDVEKTHFLKREFLLLDVKTYAAHFTAQDDPFIEIIERTGICIYEQEKQK